MDGKADSEACQYAIESDEVRRRFPQRYRVGIEVQPAMRPAMTHAFLAAHHVHQYAAHCLSGRREEVPAGVELLIAHKPQIGLVDRRRWVERVIDTLNRQLGGGDSAQLVINEREQIGSRPRVPAGCRFKETRNVRHHHGGYDPHPRPATEKESRWHHNESHILQRRPAWTVNDNCVSHRSTGF